MRLTLLHLLLVTTCSPLVVVAVQPTAECISLRQSANCSFYTECVERNMPCGPSGYAVGYGYHFCNAFGELRGEFTREVNRMSLYIYDGYNETRLLGRIVSDRASQVTLHWQLAPAFPPFALEW